MAYDFECKHLTKRFDNGDVATLALDDVNLHFAHGDFISIIGPSGSGKSTLLSLIGTLDRPTDGTLLFSGEPISTLSAKQLADFRFDNIGFIFQQFHLIPTLTALENVMASLFGRKVDYDGEERALELLKEVGLSDKANSLPSQLSGGQQQRVAVARALIHRPKWLLADEPTGNLDTHTGDIIFDLLTRLNRDNGCGVLFVTHDPELADRANRKIEMRDGQVVAMSDVHHA
ncbi:ABC transporter ATP-binding protein [Exiguobacterium sp. SL-9]|uniref:ABC transporter ATP-binding protein n=1 Tax=Exiguobacterium sp. SL-9 TaxID=2510963 RepID=UPI00103E20DF|nr:ABC transporter ATP-binding protein [Exiguobacterium sp. SL-9]TCI23514.1 ABC transporter ATP-binding protein [Exiguobacterium sp. SL-9]